MIQFQDYLSQDTSLSNYAGDNYNDAYSECGGEYVDIGTSSEPYTDYSDYSDKV